MACLNNDRLPRGSMCYHGSFQSFEILSRLDTLRTKKINVSIAPDTCVDRLAEPLTLVTHHLQDTVLWQRGYQPGIEI